LVALLNKLGVHGEGDRDIDIPCIDIPCVVT